MSTEREVKFLFEGLFFFHFPDDGDPEHRSEGRIGILSTDCRHDLSVTITEATRTRRITIPHATIRTLPETISVRKVNEGGATTESGVSIPGGWTRPRSAPSPSSTGDYPFGCIVDFEGDGLHGPDFPGPIPKKPGRLHPTLRFSTGTFYTEQLSSDEYSVTRGSQTTSLGYLAEVVGVKVTVRDAERLVCMIGGMPLELPPTVSAVRLEHVCPEFRAQSQPDPTSVKAAPNLDDSPGGSDDMQMYYDFLDVPKSMTFSFTKTADANPAQEGGGTLRGVPPAICYPTGGSGTHGGTGVSTEGTN